MLQEPELWDVVVELGFSRDSQSQLKQGYDPQKVVSVFTIVEREAPLEPEYAMVYEIKDQVGRQAKWGFPGGGIRQGESFPAGACREAKEEADLDIRLTDDDLLFALQVKRNGGNGAALLLFYGASVSAGTKVRPGFEQIDAKFFTISEIVELIGKGLVYPNHAQAFHLIS